MSCQPELLTDSAPGESVMRELLPAGRVVPQPGMYENGLLAVLGKQDAAGLLDNWAWLIGADATCLLTTGFGDVFYWSGGWVHWLNVQRGTTEPIDRELSWVLDEFLHKDTIDSKVLRRSVLNQLVERTRALRYHEAFILQPWLIMGGDDRLESYVIGHCGVYVDLVGQTWPQLRAQSST
jgi:hypothetical protein